MTVAHFENPLRSVFRTRDKQPSGLDLLYLRSARHWCRPLHPLKRMKLAATHAIEQENSIRQLSDTDLDHALAIAQCHFRRRRQAGSQLPRALALVREAARRELGLTAYPVQIEGAAVILHGYIAEMATGEGKTLTIAIAAVVNAWANRGCHVMTANDYLAVRDAQWAEPLCKRCGMSVSSVIAETSDSERRGAYMADIVYATPREVASDYLRDQLARDAIPGRAAALVAQLAGERNVLPTPRLRHMDCVIVDEADAVLIDEAVTPLIMSAPSEQHLDSAHFRDAHRVAQSLREGSDYTVDRAANGIHLSDSASDAMRRSPAINQDPSPISGRMREELVVTSLIAHHHYTENHDYTILDSRVVIIDPSTGRLMPERSYRAGLHQALEVKHALEPRPLQESLATISFQRFFSKYVSIAGATGTAREVAAELWEIYTLRTAPLPTHRPVDRRTDPDAFFSSRDMKHLAIADHAVALSRQGRAILIGCQSVATSDLLAEQIIAAGAQCAVLNAVRHAEEASVIAEAGLPGRITIATNMAGRGTDIAITPEVRELGGLHVILAEPLRSRRLERQLIGRCARQGDPGSTRAFVACGEDLFRDTVPSLSGAARKPALALLTRFAQSIAERRSRSRRRQVMRDDEKTDEMLGFAGVPH